MIKKIDIKYMTLSDVDEVIKIEETAYGEHHWSRDSFVGELKNNLARYYCARDDQGNLLGYLGAWIILEEAHITTLAVSKDFRRCKVAQALLCRFVDDCYSNEVKYITLEVRVSNDSAKSLYEKFGFNSLGVRKGYYQDNNEDALIMWTENIFYDKFKTRFIENKEKLGNIIEIK